MTGNEVDSGRSSLPVDAPPDWRRAYAQRLIVSDLIVVIAAVGLAQFLWLTFAETYLLRIGRIGQLPSLYAAIVLVVLWISILGFFATREQRYLGQGAAEYRSVVGASLRLLAVVLLFEFLFRLDIGRGPLLSAFILGILGLLLERWLWRQWLVRQRVAGRMNSRMLIAGSGSSVAHLARELRDRPEAGFTVIGACVPDDDTSAAMRSSGVKVLGNLDQIREIMESHNLDTLAIASSGKLPPQRVRELSWQLEPGRHHMIVAPSLTDVGGPRIRMRPVAGLPLLHVETPRFERGQKAQKRAVDIASSTLLLVLLSPVLAGLALAVKLTSPGPVLFRQTRVGLNGEQFTMVKFRSMVQDAESDIAELSELDRAEGNAVLFKMKDDPRVTKVGATLRRYSLDELPQLFNVLKGEMSLVGPRPPLPSEVEKYEQHVHRRFLMKPGITGLWQVSGRSNLSWEDSVRLDLYYVENWSLINDMLILWKTIRAVAQRDGAY